MYEDSQQYFVTVATGLEALLDREIKSLGVSDTKVVGSGLYFTGSLEDAYRVCLWSRLANRVLLPLGQFSASTPEELYKKVQDQDWSEQLDVNATLAVDFFAARSTITHSQYGALKVKDAIVDQFRENYGVRPSVDRQQPSIRVNVYLYRNKARLSLDLAGMSLHRRGYRDEATMAPLKENLAAALLLAMDWPEKAKMGMSFCDPLCGSGTFLIEATMMAADIAPLIKRRYFGFLGWKGHQSEIWENLRTQAIERAKTGLAKLDNLIYGSDKSTHVIAQAELNIQRAGLNNVINLRVGNINQIQYVRELKPGLTLCNPPYGVRLEKDADIARLYTNLGRVFRRQFGGWTVGIFTGSPDLVHRTRLNTTTVLKCTNGGIDCKLMQAVPEKAKHQSQPTIEQKVKTESPWNQSSRLKLQPLKHRAEMFANRLAKNFRSLEKWAKNEDIGCYRVYTADLPEYAVAIDIYESDQRYVHVQEYRAPSTIDPKVAAQRLHAVISEIPGVLGCTSDAISVKVRRRQSGISQYEKLQTRRDAHIIEEYACLFEINLYDYLDTGIFADHRKIRRWIFKEAKGKRFLNLFAYTGTASVHAMAGGAISTTAVDMSSNYLAWAERNMALNTKDMEMHNFIRADCLAWLEKPPEHQKFNLILLDPPTFSNSNKMDSDWNVQRDHVNIIHKAMRLLDKDGLLIFSNNYRKFKLDVKHLQRFKITDKTRASIPRDFSRTPKVHQCFYIQK